MVAPTKDKPLLLDGDFTVSKVNDLNFFDLSGEKAKTSGTSNKSYHAELQLAKNINKAQIFTMWGPTGGTQRKEWRHYDSLEKAEREYDSILKSKRKKGYKDIDVAQRAYGSEEAKAIIKPVEFKNAEIFDVQKSTLDEGQRRIVEIFFGSQAHFVATTLKCPLGQLTNKQIDDGRSCLDTAKLVVNRANNNLSKNDLLKLTDLTNEFYALIPHNLGSGSRGQMTNLLLDNLSKIIQKESDLDTLLDAKTVGAQLSSNATLDAKYKTLNADISYVDKNSDLYKFLESYFMDTKVRSHGYTNSKVKNIWHMKRLDKEYEFFNENLFKIAKECGHHSFEKETIRLSNGQSNKWTPHKRPDLNSNAQLFHDANVWLCWHGTRSANLIGITTRGLLIRPSGAIITGAMFGPGKYYAWQSTKSLNYTDGGYWTGNQNQTGSRFMFLLDVIMGNMFIAPKAHYYTGPPKSYHSIYGKSNVSGVVNDEMITFDDNIQKAQGRIKYLFEIVDN